MCNCKECITAASKYLVNVCGQTAEHFLCTQNIAVHLLTELLRCPLALW